MQWRPKPSTSPNLPQKRKLKTNRRRRELGSESEADKKRKPGKLSRLVKPEDMSLEDWQIELRRQFGREQSYTLKNLGDERIFSEFLVANPQSRGSYRVQIRGPHPGDNFCSCPDFATRYNTSGLG